MKSCDIEVIYTSLQEGDLAGKLEKVIGGLAVVLIDVAEEVEAQDQAKVSFLCRLLQHLTSEEYEKFKRAQRVMNTIPMVINNENISRDYPPLVFVSESINYPLISVQSPEHFDGLDGQYAQLHHTYEGPASQLMLRKYQVTAELDAELSGLINNARFRKDPNGHFILSSDAGNSRLNHLNKYPDLLNGELTLTVPPDHIMAFPNGYNPRSDTLLTHQFNSSTSSRCSEENGQQTELGESRSVVIARLERRINS